jgi:hypothetical protein
MKPAEHVDDDVENVWSAAVGLTPRIEFVSERCVFFFLLGIHVTLYTATTREFLGQLVADDDQKMSDEPLKDDGGGEPMVLKQVGGTPRCR